MSSYTWNAIEYDKHPQAQQKWARGLIDKLSLTGSENILDLDCGDGKVKVELALSVADGSVIGVDSSAQMVKLAVEHYPQNTCHNLSFKVMDTAKLTFDGVKQRKISMRIGLVAVFQD